MAPRILFGRENALTEPTIEPEYDEADEAEVLNDDTEPETYEPTDEPESEWEEATLDDSEPEEEYKPEPRFARVSAETILGGLWGGIGQYGLVQTTINPPAGRVMVLQSPAAGRKLDNLIAHTFVDRILQRILATAEGAEDFGVLVAAPLLAGLIYKKPELQERLAPFFVDALVSTLHDVVPVMKEKHKKQEQVVSDLADLSDAFEVPKGQDPMAFFLSYIFDVSPDAEQAEV